MTEMSLASAARPQASARSPITGVVILDKPQGLSSNRAMARLKYLLGASKAGYLGTLDPLATGVLVVFLGKATKLIPEFEKLDKTYRCTLRLGQRTDTFDAEGEVLEEHPTDGLTGEQVRDAIVAYEGEYQQTVPQYSAVKVDGVPAYKLARQGKAVPERTRPVRLWNMSVLSVAIPEATFEVTCTSGTYIRSLVDDIGRKLGVGAHLTALRRVRCGDLFTLENSFNLERIEERIATGDSAMVRNPADFLTDHWTLTLPPEAEQHLRDGRALPLGEAPLDKTSAGAAVGQPEAWREARPGAKVKAVRPCGTLLAVGQIAARDPHALSFHPTKVLI